MTDSNDLNLDSELRDVESRLRQLRPRTARLDLNRDAKLLSAAPRSPAWSYGLTWVSGVAVGCLLMLVFPRAPEANRQSTATAFERPGVSTPRSDRAERAAVVERAALSHSMVRQVESIVEAEHQHRRLLAGSHLTDHLAFALPTAAAPSVPSGDQWRHPLPPSSPKTRQQLMSELLGGPKL